MSGFWFFLVGGIVVVPFMGLIYYRIRAAAKKKRWETYCHVRDTMRDALLKTLEWGNRQ